MTHLARHHVVLGGGVSGLSLAWHLARRLGPGDHVTVIERESRVGGWIRTERDPLGFLFERGPRSFRPKGENGAAVLRLIGELGLEREALPSSAASARRFVWKGGSLQELPSSLLGLVTSRLTCGLPPLALRELTIPPTSAPDETIHDFFCRRFSPWVADHLGSAMVAGIYSGDPRELSVRSCFPLLHRLEQEHGSVVGGMLREGLQRPPSSGAEGDCDALHPLLEPMRKAASVSFRGGMQTLTDTLACRLDEMTNVSLRTGASVQCLAVGADGGLEVTLGDGAGSVLAADRVYSTLPYAALVAAVPRERRNAAGVGEGSAVPLGRADVGVVNMGYLGRSLPVQGFGHLVPFVAHDRTDDCGVLGMTYDSEVFPEQTMGKWGEGLGDDADDSVQRSWLTVMVGGSRSPDFGGLGVAELRVMSRRKVGEHLGLYVEPHSVLAANQGDCIPQYRLGHREWADRVCAGLASELPGLTVLGNHFFGVGIADCVHTAERVAKGSIH